jgi:hypothetical protein
VNQKSLLHAFDRKRHDDEGRRSRASIETAHEANERREFFLMIKFFS